MAAVKGMNDDALEAIASRPNCRDLVPTRSNHSPSRRRVSTSPPRRLRQSLAAKSFNRSPPSAERLEDRNDVFHALSLRARETVQIAVERALGVEHVDKTCQPLCIEFLGKREASP